MTLTRQGETTFEYEEVEVIEFNGIVGISKGGGAGTPVEIDLSEVGTISGPGAVFEQFCGLFECIESGSGEPIPFKEFDLSGLTIRFSGFQDAPTLSDVD